tara:strand:+ start:4056 stop:4400 length:345 start_codon:yes stop_codon:yes gene_type:complete
MSLAKEIASRTVKERKVIEIEGWGENGDPLVLYSKPLTARDIIDLQNKYKNFLNEMTLEGVIDLIIRKLETEDGEKAFSVADKPIIRGFEPIKLSNIGASIIGEVTSVEEAEKN